MNILLLNTSERTGGAAVAANRLMYALQKAGLDVKLLVRDRLTEYLYIGCDTNFLYNSNLYNI